MRASLRDGYERPAAVCVVVRNGFSRDLGDHFLGDLDSTLRELQRKPGPVHGENAAGFHH